MRHDLPWAKSNYLFQFFIFEILDKSSSIIFAKTSIFTNYRNRLKYIDALIHNTSKRPHEIAPDDLAVRNVLSIRDVHDSTYIWWFVFLKKIFFISTYASLLPYFYLQFAKWVFLTDVHKRPVWRVDGHSGNDELISVLSE